MFQRLLICLVAMLFLGGCGGGSASSFGPSSASTDPQASGPRTVAPVFRTTGTTVNQSIGVLGGTIQAFASDGTRFVLTVPPGALQSDTDLTMTPVAVSGELGLPVSLPFAIKIGPSGTQFFGGAELAITLPSGSPANSFHAYVMDDSGSPMNLAFSKVSGQTLTFQLYHLTTPGLSNEPVPTPSFEGPPTALDMLEAEVTAIHNQIAQLQLAGADAQVVNTLLGQADALFQTYYDGTLKANLQTAAASGSSTVCKNALIDATRFRVMVQQAGAQLNLSGLEALEIPVFRRGVTASGEEAVAADDILKFNPINEFFLPAARLRNLNTAANGLDAATIKSQLPFKVVVRQVQVNGSVPMDENEAVQIKVLAGYQLGNKPVHNISEAKFSAFLNLTGASSLNLPTQAANASGEAIFNQVSLTDNSAKITGSAKVIYTGLVIGEAGPFESASENITIEGKLVLGLSATPLGPTTQVNARVKKGRANLADVEVSYQLLSGAGSLSPNPASTTSQGIATSTFTPTSSALSTVRGTVTNGGQTALAEVQLNGAESSGLTGTWAGVYEPGPYFGGLATSVTLSYYDGTSAEGFWTILSQKPIQITLGRDDPVRGSTSSVNGNGQILVGQPDPIVMNVTPEQITYDHPIIVAGEVGGGGPELIHTFHVVLTKVP